MRFILMRCSTVSCRRSCRVVSVPCAGDERKFVPESLSEAPVVPSGTRARASRGIPVRRATSPREVPTLSIHRAAATRSRVGASSSTRSRRHPQPRAAIPASPATPSPSCHGERGHEAGFHQASPPPGRRPIPARDPARPLTDPASVAEARRGAEPKPRARTAIRLATVRAFRAEGAPSSASRSRARGRSDHALASSGCRSVARVSIATDRAGGAAAAESRAASRESAAGRAPPTDGSARRRAPATAGSRSRVARVHGRTLTIIPPAGGTAGPSGGRWPSTVPVRSATR